MKSKFKKLMSFACAVLLMIGFSDLEAMHGVNDANINITAQAASTSAEEFLASGFDIKNMNVYTGTSQTKSFRMNGRTYYQGLTFSGSNRYSYASFNTENMDTLSFTIGHVDDTAMENATLVIYLDEKGEEEIALSSVMNLREYTLDVSDASTVRFYFDNNNYKDSTYALADLKVDGSASKVICTIPEYSSSEEFMSSGFNTANMTVYDGNSKTKYFNMNGRTYYQGLVFKGGNRYSYAQFNTENVDKLSFTIGHVDDTALDDATLTVYLDGKGEDEISLSSVMNLKEYTLDVSDSSVARFYFDFSNYKDNSYALADFSVDGKSITTKCEIPVYNSSEEFLKAGFNSGNMKVYDGSSKTNFFNMNGRTYYQGLMFKGSNRYSYAQFNTENVDKLSFTIGHVDDTSLDDATLTIYFDGKGEDKISLSSLMNLMEYTLDVSDTSVVRFHFDCSNYKDKSYALADFSVDSKPIVKKNTAPVYENSEQFAASGFNESNAVIYDGSSKTKYFEMNGRTYYQGIIFNGSNRYTYAQFNTENVDTLSFTIGHVDNTALENATMTIYLDNKGEDEIKLTSNMNLMEYMLDVSDASVVRIYIDSDNYKDNSYALGNIRMDGIEPAKTHVVPKYSSAAEWIADCFNTGNADVYDGTEKTKSFDVNGETYYQGIIFKLSNRYSYAKFNTENLSSLSFKIGHVDETKSEKSSFTIVADNKEIDTLTLTADMSPLEYSLDVTDISTVRFYFDGNNYANKSYALFDISIAEKSESNVMGDVNMDGSFTVADLVLFQKWLTSNKNAKLSRWQNADFCEDGKLDVFDICLMRRKLINK